jgi:hypothetical protein
VSNRVVGYSVLKTQDHVITNITADSCSNWSSEFTLQKYGFTKCVSSHEFQLRAAKSFNNSRVVIGLTELRTTLCLFGGRWTV